MDIFPVSGCNSTRYLKQLETSPLLVPQSMKLGKNRSCHREDIGAYVLLVHYTTIICFLNNKILILKKLPHLININAD